MAQRYQVKQVCPQCGCSSVFNLTRKELQESFGEEPEVEMECSECLAVYQARMKSMCPEWYKECQNKE